MRLLAVASLVSYSAGFCVELARKFGTATTGAVSMTLRIRPPAGARMVRLTLGTADPIGNAVSTRRLVKLPR